METGVRKSEVIAELTRSPHGDLKSYIPLASRAVREDEEFVAHLIAWNHEKGAIRDAKVALPVIALSSTHPEFVDNALAHMASLDPRNFLKAARFVREANPAGMKRAVQRLVEKYLRARESQPGWWTRSAIQHRKSMKELYALFHVKPGSLANSILFKGEKLGIFAEIARLNQMPAKEAAETIVQCKIPFLVAVGALGKRAKETDVVLALIEAMSPAELQTNVKMLERLGIKSDPVLRSAFEAGLKRMVEAPAKTAVLKTTKAVEAVTDEKLKEKLRGAQEKQLSAVAVEGDWLVLADRSRSMAQAIELSRHVSATLARLVKGRVHLVFFNDSPRALDVTGKSFDEIAALTKHVREGGMTYIGVALLWALENNISVDGIALVSDGGENGVPCFSDVYTRYCAQVGKQVPVYFYRVKAGSSDVFSLSMRSAGHMIETFDLGRGTDYYSIPNIVQTMRTNRFSLVDEIMETPLKTVEAVLKAA